MAEHTQLGPIEIRSPRPIVLEALQHIHSGSALDLGAGFGRHSLLLASKGFTVAAVETDAEKLESMRAKASALGVAIDVRQGDIRDSNMYAGRYDLVLSTMVLHFLSNHEEFETAVRRMQEATAPGGMNVVCAYTDKSQLDLRPFLLNADELQKLYASWELLRFAEMPGTDTAVNGPDNGKKVVHVEMIARRLGECPGCSKV